MESPNRVVSIFKSMQRVTRSHMLDTDLYDFAAMSLDSVKDLPELDIAFDPPTDLEPATENRGKSRKTGDENQGQPLSCQTGFRTV